MPLYDGNYSSLANHVKPNDPFVQALLAAAEPRLIGRTGRSHTTFSGAAAATAGAVRAAAWVVYEQILISEPAIEFDRTTRQHSGFQQFRTVSEIVAGQSADCLELALLFSSCSLGALLEPVLLFVNVGDGSDTDHALVGLWLPEHRAHDRRAFKPNGSIPREAITDMLGADRFSDANDYWNRITEANMLVIDSSGVALGYPNRSGQQSLNFEESVRLAWKLLTSTNSTIQCAFDIRQAGDKGPFPVKNRPYVIGRKEDLELIDAAAASKNIVVSGLLGIGKTVLAIFYAFEHRHEYPEGVFLLNAADKGRALEQLAGFGRESGIEHRGRGGEPASDLILAELWAKEVVNKRGSRTLLIVDDVSDTSFLSEQIGGLLSLSSLNCRLLVTTRDFDLLKDNPDFENIPLSPLADEDATTLLLNALPPDRQDKITGQRVCKRLNNLPLLIRIAGLTLFGDQALTLKEYEQNLDKKGFLLTTRTAMPKDFPALIAAVLSRAWQGLAKRKSGPREVLKLLSILPLNESVPFEVLALMIHVEDDNAEDDVRIQLVRTAATELSATGLAEQPEEDAVRIHPVIHEFACEKARDDSRFVESSLRAAVVRLHDAKFYHRSNSKDLIRRGEQLRLLRQPSRLNDTLHRIVHLFETQLDYLREGHDALAQLALQANLDGAHELTKVLESVRLSNKEPWFRLRWHGNHERGHDPVATGHSDAVSAVAVWPISAQEDSPLIAVSGSENGELILWQLQSLESRKFLTNVGSPISGLCISPGGETAYATAWDGSLCAVALNQDNQKKARIVGHHAYPANDCAMDPDGHFIVSVSDDGTARVYSLPEGTLLHALQHSEHAPLLKCAVTRRSESHEPVLLTASQAGVVRVWNPLVGDELGVTLDIPPEETRQPLSACALAPDGRLAAVATRHEVLLWDIETGEKLNFPEREKFVIDCCFSPDSSRLMLVGRDKQVVIYNVSCDAIENRLEPWYHWLTACAFGSDDRLFFASDDGSVHSLAYDHRLGKYQQIEHIQGKPNWVNVFRADDNHALSVSTDQTICCWNLASGEREYTIEGHANWVNAFAASSDGEHVLSGTDSGNVVYWSLRGNDAQIRLTGFGLRANACAISTNATTGLAASEDSSLRQWSLSGDFKLLNHLTDGHRAAVTACAISKAEKQALSGGDDRRLILWDLDEGEIERVFEGHEDRITAVVFAHDQPDTVLSSSWDGTVKCWSIHSGQLLKDFREHTDGVTSCGSAAGGVAYSVSLDRTLRRWKLNEETSDVRIHLEHRLRGLVVDPTGEMVLCSDMSGTVFLFDVVEGSHIKPVSL